MYCYVKHLQSLKSKIKEKPSWHYAIIIITFISVITTTFTLQRHDHTKVLVMFSFSNIFIGLNYIRVETAVMQKI